MQEDLHYTFIILSSFVIGLMIGYYGYFKYKKELLSILGLVYIAGFCDFYSFHFILLTGIGTCLIKSRKCKPQAVFIYCLAHRTIYLYTREQSIASDTTNSLIFIAALKMIMVAYEVDDYRKRKSKEHSGELVVENNENRSRSTTWLSLDYEPSSFDIICYMTCFMGVLTGPIYRYRTYSDNMLYKAKNVPFKQEVFDRLSTAAVAFLVMFLSFRFVNPSELRDETFYDQNFPTRMIRGCVITFGFQARYKVVWSIMESAYACIGLGAYPVNTKPRPGIGPTILQNEKLLMEPGLAYNFETITNIKLYKTYLGVTMKEMLVGWNCCFQWWLAYFVYSSNIFPRSWKFVRGFNTLVMSAMWHGIASGYYVFFLTASPILFAEERCLRAIRDRLKARYALRLYDVFHWLLLNTLCFGCITPCFMLLDYELVVKYTRSTYFYALIFPFLCIILCTMVDFAFPKASKKLN